MGTELIARCKHCGLTLPVNHTGPCPNCGKTGKIVEANASVAIGLKVAVGAEQRHSYFVWFNKTVGEVTGTTLLDIVITIICTLLGLWIGNTLGIVVGILANSAAIILLNAFIRNRVRTKIVEITKIGLNHDPFREMPTNHQPSNVWDVAKYYAARSSCIKALVILSIGSLIIVLSFGIAYFLLGIWSMDQSLTYVSIAFILWAGFLHLSDRLRINEHSATKLFSGGNLENLIDLIIRKKIGWMSLVFLVLGVFGELVNLALAITNHH
jgi:hypothetical protein